MSHIEDEYKKRFTDQELNSDDIDMDDMWNNISKEIAPKQSDRDRRFLPFFLLLAGISLVGGLYLITSNFLVSENSDEATFTKTSIEQKKNTPSATDILNIPNNSNSKAQETPSNNKTEIKNSKNEFSASSKKQSTASINPTSKNEINDLSTIQNSNTTIKVTSKISTPKLPYTNSANTPPVELTQSNNATQTNSIEAISNEFANATSIVEKKISSNKPVEQIVKPNFPTISLLTNPLQLLIYKNEVYHNLKHKEVVAKEKSTKDKDNIQWNIGLFGGLNTFTTKYKSADWNNLANLKEQTETSEFGISLGLNTSLILKDHWILQSGLEYHRMQSKFDYTKQKSVVELRPNQLIKIWVDVASQDTVNRQYADTTVNATETRYILHHNKVDRLTLPVEIGWQNQKGKVSYGVTGGINFNFTMTQSGRILDKNEVVINFDNNTTASMLKDFSLGYRVSPFIGYQISDKVNIAFRPRISWFSNNDFDQTDLSIKYQQIEFNVGVGVSF